MSKIVVIDIVGVVISNLHHVHRKSVSHLGTLAVSLIGQLSDMALHSHLTPR